MTTPAQLEANRANALKSTGPRTAEGKEVSRRNALRHGLAAEALVLPDEEAEVVAARVREWTPSFGPKDAYDGWLVGQVALSSVQIDRCQAHERAIRGHSAGRAAVCWEEDREAAAEALGATLHKAPSVVARKLRGTRQGCAWLIGRWEGLQAALERDGEWDERQIGLALDLLGTPTELRKGPSPLVGDAEALLVVIRANLDRLRALKVGMDTLDEGERAAAEVGLGLDPDRALNLARRYEAAAVRRFESAVKRLTEKDQSAARPEREALDVAAREVAREKAEGARLSRMLAAPAPAPAPAPEELPPIRAVQVTAAVANPAPPGENRKARRARLARARRA